jgi:hypothetical protein
MRQVSFLLVERCLRICNPICVVSLLTRGESMCVFFNAFHFSISSAALLIMFEFINECHQLLKHCKIIKTGI